VGIAFLWFSQRIAGSLGLIITSWAMQGIIAVAAFIIIVVFRNEIRSVLQAKNLRAILWSFPHRGSHPPVEAVVESAFEMTRKGIGALIVFPGKEDLKEAVQGGISWRGLLSKEMLMSIFWHDNHDGAAIIEGDQVTEVSAILPLSHRVDLPSNFGTRHRAAAGLAETTDALVIIVSEERGEVSVAKNSKISDMKEKEDLARTLWEHLGTSKKQRGYLRRQRLELAMVSFVSVTFVIGIWFSLTKGLDTVVTLEIPVEYMDRDPKMELFDTSVNSVHLDLRGSVALIKSIRPEQIKVRLDLSQSTVGVNTFSIGEDDITLPPGISLKRVVPSFVEVTLDVPVERELSVQVDWVGKLPENLILLAADLDPERVAVLGGGRILESIQTIYTEKVRVDSLEKPGAINVSLALDNGKLKLAPGTKNLIKLKYLVRQRRDEPH
jgi:DNA integrity scanning protein DisA with diadenylate cyclase activity